MNTDDMSKGASVEIDVRLMGKTLNFKSDIALIIKDSILIRGIRVDNRTVGFTDKCTVDFMYKEDGKLYKWDDVQVKLVRYDGEIYHMVRIAGDGKVHNRREAYRQYIGEDMPIYINTASGTSAIDVLVKDISETGVGFITKEELEIDRTFRLKIRENQYMLTLSGIIIRKEELSNLNSNLYGCKFIEKDNALVKYIARKQGEQLKNKSRIYASTPKRNLILK